MQSCVNFMTAFDYLLMLTIFHVQKFLSFSTDVYVIFCYWNISMKCTHFIFICHLLMLTYFLCRKYSRISILFLIIYWCWLFYMWKMFLSFLTDVYVSFCYWNISMKCTHFILICHLLMLTFFYLENVLIILNWCLCDFLVLKHIDEVDALHPHLSYTAFDYLLMLTYFSCAKCSYHSRLMFMWFSVTETYRWSGWTSSSFVTYWCWHIFYVENILRFQYCFWLFTDVDIFFMCKMFLSFSTDVYVIFCYWNILMKWMDFIFICHWHIFVWKIFYDFNTAFDYLVMLTYRRLKIVNYFTCMQHFSCRWYRPPVVD